MANYNVDISVAIKNTNKLTAFNKQLDKTAKIAERARKGLKEIGQTANTNVATLNNLSAALSKAKSEFRDTVLGTKASVLAARDLATAERKVNKELKERTALMNKFRFQGGGSAFKSFSQSASQIQSPNVFTTAQQKSIDRQNRKQGRTPVPFGPQQFIGPLPMQGPMFGPMQGPNPMMTVNNNPRILRNLEASRASREASAFRIRPGTQFERPIGPALSAVMKSINRHAKKIEKHTGKSAQIQTQQSRGAVFTANPQAFSQPIGPVRPGMLGRLGIGTGANPQGMFANPRGRAGRLSGALSSGLIGGGFPLLFGQGALGAAGGGIGGVAGGALGGPFGFGLSIAGTAIAQRIQESIDFRKSVSELNKEMEQMGLSSNISARGVIQLGKSLGITKQEAIKALQQFKRFGDNALLFARSFGGDFAKFDALSQANTVESALSAIRKINKDLTLEDELKLILSIRRKGVEATINDLITDTLQKQKELDTKDFKKTEGSNRVRPGVLRRQADELQTINERNTKTVEELTKVRDLQDQIRIASEENSFSIVKGLQDVNSEIRRLNNAQFQIVELSKTLGSSFSESFKGIIKGTMSVGDAFRNMFMRIADHFLDMAAQMMAAQISKGFLGMFGGLFGGGFNGLSLLDGMANPFSSPASTVSPFLGFANGGRPPVGRPSIVGERGAEMFVPDRAGTIIPNHELGGMGGTKIVVNVDASGSNVEGDEDEGRALGVALSAAIETELIKQKRPGGLLA